MEHILLCGAGGLLYHIFPLLERRYSVSYENKKRMNFDYHHDLIKEIMTIRFWIYAALYVLIACLIGYGYFRNIKEVHGLLEIHIGISSPLLIKTMLNLKFST